MYSPLIGRFMQRDPIGPAAGDENLYRYVDNDPINFDDPSGMQALQSGDGTGGTWQPRSSDTGTPIQGCAPTIQEGGRENVLRLHAPNARTGAQVESGRTFNLRDTHPPAAVPGPVPRDRYEFLDRYRAFLQAQAASDDEKVRFVIVQSLIMAKGDAQKAFQLVYDARHINGAGDDVLTSADKFFNMWVARKLAQDWVHDHLPVLLRPLTPAIVAIPTGLGAQIISNGYQILKSSDSIRESWLLRDDKNCPPSPPTRLQWSWGSRGATAAAHGYPEMQVGSPEWKDFMKWLDKVTEETYY
jgi:hypothetical protein